jgi:type II secretory pathway pseudopilin PulG
MRTQRGFTLVIAVVLISALATLAVAHALRIQLAGRSSAARVTVNFTRAHAALLGYVAQMGRLPCPAVPTSSAGTEDRNAGNSKCNSAQGTLPWRTIGLSNEFAIDPWGRKISYRVYTGNAGTLTQDEGVSLVQCSTTDNQGTTNVSGGGNEGGICKSNNKTKVGSYSDAAEVSFLGSKGLTVADYGVTQVGVAYVLICHGATGYGGYTSTGIAMTAPSNASEIANTTATGPFVAAAASGPTIGAADASHFDDLISYVFLKDLIVKAGRNARNWP